MEFDRRIKDAHSKVQELKTTLQSRTDTSSSEELVVTKALIELEKVRVSILIAQALDRIATKMR